MNEDSITLKKKTITKTIIGFFALFLLFMFFGQKNITPHTYLDNHSNDASPADYTLKNIIDNKDIIDLDISKSTYTFTQGKQTRVFTYNNQMPGPLIKGYVGETKIVRIKNNLDEPTTIHWHGIQQANVEDGVPQVTQDPIQPGEEYEYHLELRTPGLYWYHSHVDAHKQVESGLQGVLLVENPNNTIDSGNILVLDDVLLGNNYEFRNFDLGVMHGRYGNVLLVNGQEKPTINLTNNRLRIVNTANARSFNIQFENQQFTVIGMDIDTSDHFKTNILTVNPGERYDILLPQTNSKTITLSHYTSRGSAQLATLVTNQKRLEENDFSEFEIPFDLESLMKKEPDEYATLEGVRGGHMGIIWSINNKYYPVNTEVFTFNEGDIIKMRIKNTLGQPHPMHLHGQKFIVLARNGVKEEHFGWKDTVMVGNREEVDIVFVAEEKGKWVFHCHILEHAQAGMLSIVEVVS